MNRSIKDIYVGILGTKHVRLKLDDLEDLAIQNIKLNFPFLNNDGYGNIFGDDNAIDSSKDMLRIIMRYRVDE